MSLDRTREYSPAVERAGASGSSRCKHRSALAGLVLVGGFLSLSALANPHDDLALRNAKSVDPAQVATSQGVQGRFSSHALDDESNLPGPAKIDFGRRPRAGFMVLAKDGASASDAAGAGSEDVQVLERNNLRDELPADPAGAAPRLGALALESLAADIAKNALAHMERWLIEAEDPREIRQNLEALAKVSEFLTAALPALIDARADWDPPVKDATRSALQVIDIYADHMVELLEELGLARHPDPRIARSSIRVLSSLGMHVYQNEKALDVLADALDRPDLGVRYYAARGLLQIDEHVKAFAAAAERGDLSSESEVRRLTVALRASPALQRSAVSALARLGPEADAKREELIRKLRTGDPKAKAEAVEELGDIGVFVTSPLPALVGAPKAQQRVAAGEAPADLYAMLTVPDLIEALDDQDTRLVSAGFLGEVGAAAAAASADLERLRDGASSREAAVVADDVLMTISGHSDDAVVALLAAVKSPDPITEEAAVRALGHLGSQAGSETSAEAVLALIDVLQGGSPDAQAQAAAALADIKGDPELTVPALIRALQAGDPAVQYEAARALRRLHAAAAIPELREALNADDLWLRYHAALALQDIDWATGAGRNGLQGVLKDVEDQSDSAVAELVEGVRIHDAAATRKLRHIGPPATAAVPGLLDVLRQARPEDQDQIAALVRTVGASSLPEVRAAIRDLESAPDVAARARAARTLGDIGARARTVLPTLTRELSAREPPVHIEVVQALSDIGTTTTAAIDALVIAALADDAVEVREAARKSLSYTVTQMGMTQRMQAQVTDRETIRSVQRRLNQLGYRAGPEDGIMGPQTHRAISAYQARLGMEPNGMLTPDLIDRMLAGN